MFVRTPFVATGMLYKVVLPQAMTGIASTAIFCLIFAWNEYAFASLLTSGDAQTMPPFIPFIIGEGGQIEVDGVAEQQRAFGDRGAGKSAEGQCAAARRVNAGFALSQGDGGVGDFHRMGAVSVGKANAEALARERAARRHAERRVFQRRVVERLRARGPGSGEMHGRFLPN